MQTLRQTAKHPPHLKELKFNTFTHVSQLGLDSNFAGSCRPLLLVLHHTMWLSSNHPVIWSCLSTVNILKMKAVTYTPQSR